MNNYMEIAAAFISTLLIITLVSILIEATGKFHAHNKRSIASKTGWNTRRARVVRLKNTKPKIKRLGIKVKRGNRVVRYI